MKTADQLDIFLVTLPGLEPILQDEAVEKGFAAQGTQPGGVTVAGDWTEAWRANLVLRGATRVLVRLGGFPVFHLAQLDKRARKFPWGEILRADIPVRVDVTCRKSRIYHAGAARQRIEKAIGETLGAPIGQDPAVTLKVRIDNDFCTISVDLSGDALHRRGYKAAVGKAPLRETMAALFLRQCGFRGTEPVVDPMCGSGTFVIEASEIAAGLPAGRARSFAFEHLANFDRAAWEELRDSQPVGSCDVGFFGFDRNAGAIRSCEDNANRAGVSEWTHFAAQTVSDLRAPCAEPGLIIVNPPYGARIGDRKGLRALYGTFGKVVAERFRGWRVGLITSDGGLAKATGLPLVATTPPIDHGGIKVKLYQCDAL